MEGKGRGKDTELDSRHNDKQEEEKIERGEDEGKE